MGREDRAPLWGTDFVTRKQRRLCYWSEQGGVFRNLYQLRETPQWIRTALDRVLQNRGSRTPGVDGLTASHLRDAAAQERLVQDIVTAMRAHAYRPHMAGVSGP